MAFSAVITKKDVMGSHRVVMGTIAQVGGDTGGVVATGLRKVENFSCTVHCATISVSGGDVTITTANPAAAQSGFWSAIGM